MTEAGRHLDHMVVTAAPGLAEDAPVVVLSNSIGSRLSMWDAQVDALAGHFLVVRHDTRGHGDSATPPGPYRIDDLADDVVALLDELKVERAHLVGLSLGGMSTQQVAILHPDRVDRVGVLCTAPVLGPPSAWLNRAATVRAEGMAAVSRGTVEKWYTEDWRATHRDLVARRTAEIESTDPDGYAWCCEAIAAMDLRADLPRATAPLLAIAGAQDPSTPPDRLRQIVDAWGGPAELLVVDPAAHLANEEQPAAVTAALLNHLLAGTA